MIPGVNPRQMKQMMKKMGMQQEEIPAVRVVIYTPDKRLVIENPSVQKVNMMGQQTFQVAGEEYEAPLEEEEATPSISDDDIQTVIAQANCTEDEARKAIGDANGDLAQAIMDLTDDA